MDIESWKSQLRKGAAELAVLNVLAEEERYGLDISKNLAAYPGLGITDGALYPLLNRLQKAGKVTARWRHMDEAVHPRKYYRLTDDGRSFLDAMREAWTVFAGEMNQLTKEHQA